MLTVYLLEMYRATGDERYLDDCVREITAHAAQLRNPATGLWYHGWSATNYCYEDNCCEYLWNSTSCSAIPNTGVAATAGSPCRWPMCCPSCPPGTGTAAT